MPKTKLTLTQRGRNVRDIALGLTGFAAIIFTTGWMETYL